MNKKKLLILNGSHSDIPLIIAGKNLGYSVITTGNNPNLIGHRYADEYYYADYSDKNEILSLAKKLKIDAICSCANDFGAITASYVSEELMLPGHDSYEKTLCIHHKDKFKKIAKKLNIQTPPADIYDNIDDAIMKQDKYQFPIIVKPIDLTGGKGISKITTKDQFIDAVKTAHSKSKAGIFIIEPFINGTYHSLSTFIINQKVVAYFSDNEYSYLNPFLVSTSAAPATDIPYVLDKLLTDANTIADNLHLVDGILHIQYVMKDKKPYILEMTRRCSGDWYAEPVQKALNINWAEWIVKAECGLDCADIPKFPKQSGFCGRHCIMGSKNGTVKNVHISDSINSNIYSKICWWKPGDKIENYLVDKLGILFLQYASEEEMLEKTKQITDLVTIEYE